nr:reverse transcriptase domain-containing protein [Tanacetum cinerariifolium]
MAKEDEEKTAFITSQRIFCYTKMPFGLRNAEATYQRLVDKAFHKQIGRNLEVYVDDLVIKSHTEDEIVRDIEETFKTLMEINMKLNPKKCTFTVEEGMFLGYTVNTKGLKVCPDKVDAVLSLPSPKRLKDVQKLNEKIGSLNSVQTNEAADSTAPVERDELIVYLASSKETGIKRSGDKLYINGEISDGLGTYQQTPKEILSSTLNRSNYEPVNTTGAIKTGDSREATKVEHRIRRICNTLQTQSANVDSRLVANQVNRTYIAKEADMIRYLGNVRTLTSSFKAFSIWQFPKSENKKADALSKISSTSFAHLSKQVLVKELKEKSISKVEIVVVVVEEEGDTWMNPIFEYLTEETLPADVKEARAVRRKSQRFAVINRTLYKKIFPRSMVTVCRATSSKLCPERDTRRIL